jgi:Zn-dependent protease
MDDKNIEISFDKEKLHDLLARIRKETELQLRYSYLDGWTGVDGEKFNVSMNFADQKYSTENMTAEEKRKLIEGSKTKPKSKIVLVLLLCLKFLTKGLGVSAKLFKVGLAGVSFALYAYMFTWKFALVIMVQLFIHEYGHIWAMKRCGIKTKGIYFIPFFGGAAVASESFKTRWDEVYIAMMGPVFGFMCAAASYAMWLITDLPFYAAASSWMAMLNVVNLIPINPLDGGRVMKSMIFSMKRTAGLIYMVLGILATFTVAVMFGMWTLVILGFISLLELVVEWKWRTSAPLPTLSTVEVFRSAGIYLFMILALSLLMYAASSVPGASIASELLK